MARTANIKQRADFIWSIADLLRGDYKQSDYGKVILPLTVLRRLDCVLQPTKDRVLDFLEHKAPTLSVTNIEPILKRVAGFSFYNRSMYTFPKLTDDPDNIAANLRNYINGFSSNAREIIEYFKFDDQITRLDEAKLLYIIITRFSAIDLHPKDHERPDGVSNDEMGYVFEELIRKFAEISNETAGEHFTPREVIKLMVNLLFMQDRDVLIRPGIVRTIYDPACGTGGMLSVAEEYIKELNEKARPVVFGQEINPESYAICKADMLIKGQDVSNIKFGNTFTVDGLQGNSFDYMLSNPPFGVEWKKVESYVKKEHEKQGFKGRFGAGLPRISDGSFLFLQHMIAKMKQDGGSRIGIVFNGSPLFSGGATSGESAIRQWIIENDLLEAIVALPDQLFYNTGIFTYVWILSNQKTPARRGKVQLINATHFYQKMSRSLGNKRHVIGDGADGAPDHIAEITRIYGDFRHDDSRLISDGSNGDIDKEEVVVSKIFDNEDFGYHRIVVERPLRLNFQTSPQRIRRLEEETSFKNLGKGQPKDEIAAGRSGQEQILSFLAHLDSERLYKNRVQFEEDLQLAANAVGYKLNANLRRAISSALSERDSTADICLDVKGDAEPDTSLRDYENVPLKEDIKDYFAREVQPHVSDAWVDESRTVRAYEINFTRYFYRYKPLRPLSKIRAEILELEEKMDGTLAQALDT